MKNNDEMLQRPRRNRKSEVIRQMVQETHVSAANLIFPLFIVEGNAQKTEVAPMPGIYRYSIDNLLREVESCLKLGLNAFDLFPNIDESLKDKYATESHRENSLYLRAIREVKRNFPEACVITDVAMDPYSSDGHDGIVENGEILNDETLEVLGKMALAHAQSGADIIAPSDMMDGRVGYIRRVLDENKFTNVSIMSYSAKYASAFYGPFRDALNSAPKFGDKKSYQMNPANQREALIEANLDEMEGADFLMVKPALPYLDVIKLIKDNTELPVAAYNVSGEYAMLKAAIQKGWLNEQRAITEVLTGIRRAGASAILTYHAKEVLENKWIYSPTQPSPEGRACVRAIKYKKSLRQLAEEIRGSKMLDSIKKIFAGEAEEPVDTTGKPDISRVKSAELYEKAKTFFPGGVNSPVRAFKSVYGTPLFIEKGDGCHIWDADGNQFIDFCCSWGPLILGHNNAKVREKVTEVMRQGMSFGAPTALENELAGLILKNNKFIEKLRFVSSGTEAVMSAIRLARGHTKRDKILKFEGCYHGHSDSLLVKAGSGLVTFGETSSAGVPKSFADETIVVALNDRKALQKAFKEFRDQIAAVIIEPIPANNGLLLQDKEFLEFLRDICTKNGALLLFDEVISGFRIGFEGAAGYYQVNPDIVTYGKIIGGGLPVGAYGSSASIMANISPDGAVYQAGTLSGNPVAMAAGIAQLTELLKMGFYKELNNKTEEFAQAIQRFASAKNYAFRVFSIGSIFWFAFTDKDSITRADEIDPTGMEKFKKLHRELINRGVYLGPSGYEVGFISSAHTKTDLEKAKRAIFDSLSIVFSDK